MNVNNVYEDIQDITQLKKHMNDTMEEYNNTPGMVEQDLVLFRDAIEHGTDKYTAHFSKIFIYCSSID